jgi:porphobilinogen deaminase
VVIGSRKSELAMWQAREVVRLLNAAAAAAATTGGAPRYTFEIVSEVSTGDVQLGAHLASLAAAQPGIFTKELEVGLQVRAGGRVCGWGGG